MRKLYFFSYFIITNVVYCSAQLQPDTIIAYTIKTGKIDTILPVSFNSTDTFAITPFNIGSLGITSLLSQVPPVNNLFTNSMFCDISKADDVFNLSDFPIRTTTALRYYNSDTAKTSCSGILVSPNFVLSAGHCVYNYFNQTFSYYDSLRISPSFNNGQEPSNIPGSYAKKIYIFKTFYDKKNFDDIALIELEEAIGLQTGWVGIGYSTNFSNYQNKVFHKFSYPAYVHPFDSTRVYNGDTMYYNYGLIDNLNPNYGVIGANAAGIPGQSGSSFLYANNNDYYSVGVFNFSNYYTHYPISNHVFYQFQHVLNTTVMSVNEKVKNSSNVLVWPNPFSDEIKVQTKKPGNFVFSIYNSIGEKILKQAFEGSFQSFLLNDLTQGIYFICIEQDNTIITSDKFIKR